MAKMLNFKHPLTTLTTAADTILFYFYLSVKIKIDISYELSVRQMIHTKYQALFSKQEVKEKKKSVFRNAVCCYCVDLFKG